MRGVLAGVEGRQLIQLMEEAGGMEAMHSLRFELKGKAEPSLCGQGSQGRLGGCKEVMRSLNSTSKVSTDKDSVESGVRFTGTMTLTFTSIISGKGESDNHIISPSPYHFRE